MMNPSPTPISDIDHKIDIIDHVNQDHTQELLAIAQSHMPGKKVASALIVDIFEQGVEIKITPDEPPHDSQTLFVPFEIEGSLEDKILYLAYASIVRQGLEFAGNGKRFFEVTGKRHVTDNIIRLTVKSDLPLPEHYAGYAYALVLKTLKKRPAAQKTASGKKHWFKHVFDHVFIWLMKNLSKKNRDKMLHTTNKNIRLYTLRKSWKSSDSASFADCGEIDVYTHGDTPGSQWAQQIRPGDVFMSRSETADKHPHLAEGQAVIIADETAYPAAAGIMDNWTNSLPPVVVVVSAKAQEQQYFRDDMLPVGAQLHRVVCSEQQQARHVLEILRQVGRIDGVWAALESTSAKEIRHYLRNERGVSGKHNHTKAYWHLKSKHE